MGGANTSPYIIVGDSIMLEFKSKVLRFKFDDEIHELRYPTVKEIREMQKLQKEESDEVNVIESMLNKLGMKEGLFDKLEVDHVEAIVGSLVNEKKK